MTGQGDNSGAPSATVDTERAGQSRGSPDEGVAGSIELSIIIPCLNEMRSIEHCVRDAREILDRCELAGEVVVADNGSSDGSAEIAAAAGARIVHVAVRGYGSAVRGGTADARGRFVIFADADGQHDYNDIPRILEKLREGYDLVVGNRFTGEMKSGSMTWSHRYIGNPLISGLIRLIYRSPVHDPNCGIRGFRRELLEEIDVRTTGFEFCVEMVIKAARHKMRVAEIPITVLADERDRPPHLRTIPDGFRHLTFLLMCSPTSLFIIPGAILLAVGVALVSWLALGTQHIGRITLATRAELFGVLVASIGFGIVTIGLFARVFSYREPIRSNGRSLERALKRVKLEEGLAVGSALVIVGFVGIAWEGIHWAIAGFHLFPNDEIVIFWTLWLVLGVQICFASFFLSMLGISRGTWTGDSQ